VNAGDAPHHGRRHWPLALWWEPALPLHERFCVVPETIEQMISAADPLLTSAPSFDQPLQIICR
jgi:hypothetical protein